MDILDAINLQKYKNYIEINSKKKLYDIWIWSFVIEYTDKEDINKEKELFWEITEQDTECQSPKFCGEFEQNGKFYLILVANVALLGKTNAYLYKWMIIDPQEYKRLWWKKIIEESQGKLIDDLK